MEHPGLVALGQPLTLIAPGEETLARKQHYAHIAMHELAHYWFGDYVTNAFWDDTWLNEALATWIDTKLTDKLEPAWRFAEASRHAGSAMSADALKSAKRIREPIQSKNDIEDAFDAELTYDKGSAVLGMFERWIGPEAFQRGIRRYMREHAWSTAVADDLLRALSAEAGKDIGPAFKTFLDQPGVPLVSVEPICGAGAPRLRLAQKRFVPSGSEADAAALWQIPLCVKYGAAGKTSRACTLLDRPAAEIPLEGACPEWIFPNEDGAGYYRADYRPEALRVLAAKAKSALTPVERASLLDDAAALTGTGALSIGDALALLPAFADGGDRVAFERGFAILEAARGDLLPPDLRRRFARFLQATYGERARALGLAPRPGERLDDAALRPALFGLLAGPGEDAALRREAHDLVARWLDDHRAVPADVAGAALRQAGRTNDRALFDRLKKAALAAQDHHERTRLVGALGTFTDPALARDALALLLGDALDLRDGIGILFTSLGNPETREVAWTFYKEHLDDPVKRMRSDEAMGLFRAASIHCDEAHRAEVRDFLGPRAEKVDGAPRALAASLEEIGLCAKAAQMNRASLEAFLKSY
jgi:hypothetical protein